MKKWFILLFLTLPIPSFTQYTFQENVPYLYTVQFKGALTMDAQFYAYTNESVQFSANICVTALETQQNESQSVIAWRISPMTNSSAPEIFNSLWDNYLQQSLKDIAYTVRLTNGQFLAITKSGKSAPFTQLIPLIFPVTDTAKGEYQDQANIQLSTNRSMLIQTKAWDFAKYQLQTNQVVPLLNTNTQFISRFYQRYAQNRKKNFNYLNWLQQNQIIISNPYGQIFGELDFVSIYFINQKVQTLEGAMSVADMNFILPFQNSSFQQNISISLKGEINTRLNKSPQLKTMENYLLQIQSNF